MKQTIKIKGMHCASCEILLKEAIEEQGVHVLQADYRKGEIAVEMKDGKQREAVEQVIVKEGYTIA
ncbi:MAG: heavy-metal-associated domain-containing protein [Candidatus Iainarchaeum archaeon]|uniref:Heavy-metal-associated domain-containing protein n=1 Tax=Candidatus Iainarchaeum sp. TaxID=3101447 RepID=A0A7T9DKT1_9ARCH|nr:MAG: heavy-metal-associated domain-containing protein [Candidatus Diapherotrites archaeon]